MSGLDSVQSAGVMPKYYPVMNFVFDCNTDVTLFIVCVLVTNRNPVFTIGDCGCEGQGCGAVLGPVNFVPYLITACKIEIYERIKFNEYYIVQYTSLSEVQLTINTNYHVKSPKYFISPVNTVIFGQYICKNFHYDDTSFPATICGLDYTNCASILDTTDSITSSTQLQTLMNEGLPVLLLLPDNEIKMKIIDKGFFPLAVSVTGPIPNYFLLSTGSYNTVTVTKEGSNSTQNCAIRYSTRETTGLYVYTFGDMCNPKLIPSGTFTSISASGSSPTTPAYFCDGYTGICVSKCNNVSGCNGTNVVPNRLIGIVEGVFGNHTNLNEVLPSVVPEVYPINQLSNYIAIANDYVN